MGILGRLFGKNTDNEIRYVKLRPVKKVRSKGNVAVELGPAKFR